MPVVPKAETPFRMSFAEESFLLLRRAPQILVAQRPIGH